MDRVGHMIRIELAIAFMAPVVAAFLFIAKPACPCVTFYKPLPLVELIPWAGFAGLIIGLVLIVRLSRIDPDAGERSWRYHDD